MCIISITERSILMSKNLKNSLKTALCVAEILIILIATSACASDESKENTQISLKQAEETALLDANVKASDVSFKKEKLDYDDGIAVYDIDFYTDTHEYEYEINAVTGNIHSKEIETRRNINAGQESNNGDTGQSINNGAAGNYIGEEEAKAIAVKHAGVSPENVNFYKVELDYDDGQKVYEIEFYVDGIEYDYEINALSGKIIKYERDER